MIQGAVNSHLEAVIWVKVFGATGLKADIEAIVDTGYDSYLTLPYQAISALGLPPYAPAEVTLADGRVEVMELFERSVEWEGQRLPIPILRTNGDAIVGMALLTGNRLTVDIVEGGIVRIEPFSAVSSA